MKTRILLSVLATLTACSAQQQTTTTESTNASNTEQTCPGTTELPAGYALNFTPIDDPELLAQAVGEPNKGGLCKGQVYQANESINVTLYRAWNGTNPNSKLGRWWAWQVPEGSIADYREHYEICYQWSALDQLVSCELSAGAKVVVGPGQSAECSQYLTYSSSARQQVFVVNAADVMSNCQTFTGEFSWH